MKPSLPKGEKQCLFCSIAKKEIPSKLVYEDEKAVAFADINPQAPVHLLIVPKGHISALSTVKPDEMGTLAHLFSLVPKLAEKNGVLETGFRAVVNSGEAAGQTVFHLHIHLLGGRIFGWPPG
jgi:histidine triad (HIT) family protein